MDIYTMGSVFDHVRKHLVSGLLILFFRPLLFCQGQLPSQLKIMELILPIIEVILHLSHLPHYLSISYQQDSLRCRNYPNFSHSQN